MKSKYWKYIGGVCLLMIGTFFKTLDNEERKEETKAKYLAGYYDDTTYSYGKILPNKQSAYIPPEIWRNYMIGDAFTISIPPTVELRGKDEPYTKQVRNITWRGYKVNESIVVFQQKGLAIANPDAFKTYCRIMIDVQNGIAGDFLKANEFEELGVDEIKIFQDLANQSALGEVIGKADVRWVRIEDIYAIEIDYVRRAEEGNRTHVTTYYLFNDDKCTNITLSYRMSDSEKWAIDFENIIRTFKWNNE